MIISQMVIYYIDLFQLSMIIKFKQWDSFELATNTKYMLWVDIAWSIYLSISKTMQQLVLEQEQMASVFLQIIRIIWL